MTITELFLLKVQKILQSSEYFKQIGLGEPLDTSNHALFPVTKKTVAQRSKTLRKIRQISKKCSRWSSGSVECSLSNTLYDGFGGIPNKIRENKFKTCKWSAVLTMPAELLSPNDQRSELSNKFSQNNSPKILTGHVECSFEKKSKISSEFRKQDENFRNCWRELTPKDHLDTDGSCKCVS